MTIEEAAQRYTACSSTYLVARRAWLQFPPWTDSAMTAAYEAVAREAWAALSEASTELDFVRGRQLAGALFS